jgi:hemolysin-activating ACP:hemolysin acyltransferase
MMNERNSAKTVNLRMAAELSGNCFLAIIVAPEGELQRKSDLLNQIFASTELRVLN